MRLNRCLGGWLLLWCAGVVSAVRQTYDFGVDHNVINRRQSNDNGITGIGRIGQPGEPIRIRKEMRDLKKDPYQWNLFILSLSLMLNMDPNDRNSWYQIAGIHGMPLQVWGNVPGANNTNNVGYCQHGSILFPSWHRPYIALVEQLLWSRMGWIASLFEESRNQTEYREYQRALREWAMPYWDWAARPGDGSPIYPVDFEAPEILVYGPRGYQSISNPLYSFEFTAEQARRFPYKNFNTWTETKRCPGGDGPDAQSNNLKARQNIEEAGPSQRERLFNLFSSVTDYRAFSNKHYDPYNNGSSVDSIEAIHDHIHLKVGDKGHMEYIVLSSFDPVFFLHHCFVDKITAFWQILNPSAWVTRWEAVEPSFTNNIGELQDVNSPLLPFWNRENRFWTSATSRETTPFGYEYEDTAGFTLSQPASREAVDRVRAVIRAKYGVESPSNLRRLNYKRSATEMQMAEAGRSDFRKGAFEEAGKFTPDLSLKSVVPCPPTSSIIKGGYYHEWYVNVKIKNRHVNGPATVLVFLGDVPDCATEWGEAPNLAGSMAVFSMAGVSNPDNFVGGTIPLTGALMKLVSGQLIRSMEPRDMTPYLKSQLHYRIVGPGGDTGLDPKDMDGLELTVATARVRDPESSNELPEWEQADTVFRMSC